MIRRIAALLLALELLGLSGWGCVDRVLAQAQTTSVRAPLSRIKSVLTQLAGDDLRAYLGFSPVIKLIEVDNPAAFMVKDTIIISSGLLDALGSDDELAFVLAHELSHATLGHHSSALTGRSGYSAREFITSATQNEIEADQSALAMLSSSGFNPLAPRKLLQRISVQGLARGLPVRDIYPSLAPRIAALPQVRIDDPSS